MDQGVARIDCTSFEVGVLVRLGSREALVCCVFGG